MRGQVLGVEPTRGVGIMLGADGARLEFPLAEWRSQGQPAAGQAVDYVLENGQARQVYGLPPEAGAAASASAAVRTNTGSVLGGIALGCLALGFVVPLLPTVAALILGIIGAGRARAEGDETGLVLSRIGWIGATVFLSLGVLIVLSAILFFGGLLAALTSWGVTLPGITT